MKINKLGFALNSILDLGLYIEGHDQLIFFIKKYLKSNKRKLNVNYLDIAINEKDEFVKYIYDKYKV